MPKSVPHLSVIIPVLNEGAIAQFYLTQFPYQEGIEVLMVDGGSGDNTMEVLQQFTAFPLKLLTSPKPGRGCQMNHGATQAQGEILFFLHLDSRLSPDCWGHMEQTLARSGVVAGAFSLGIDCPGWPYRLLEQGIQWRSQWGQLPYGDQGLFLSKATFDAVGGFPEWPIMEDYELVQRLRKLGQVAIAPSPLVTSGRRWQKLGLWRTTLINQAIIMGYHLGISPPTLARWYGR